MIDEVIQLEDFIVSSNKVDFHGEIVNNVLLGKYLTLKHITTDEDESGTLQCGNLFMIHEKFANESIPLFQYQWKKWGKFDFEDDSVKISDPNYTSTVNYEDMEETLSDDMMAVIDNHVCFKMQYCDHGYDFHVLIEEKQIVGFLVEAIASWINTPNVLLEKACQEGNLETVKKLLTHSDIKKRAVLDYGAFYFACTEAHKDIIAYLMSSPDLEKHSKINNKEEERFTTPFIILCHANPEIVRELIFTLPKEAFQDIKEFLEQPDAIQANQDVIYKALSIREQKDQLEHDLNTKIGNENKFKI